jgi:uncharacterized protein YecE (DUF72 family)
MSTRWHIGAKDLHGAITAYAKRFNLLEVRLTLGGPASADENAPSPTPSTLRRWRKAVPPAFDFAVVAGPNLSRVKLTEPAERELEAARAAIDALQARCFVLRTTPDVTPAPLWRERLAKVIARFPRDATHFVWEPSGVWELADAAAQARSWGIVLAVDPSRDPVAPGPVAYVRLRALGETRSFGPSTLERVVRAVGLRREVFCVIETDTALAEAKRLRHLARALKTPARRGGAGRLVRPRGGIVVRDDEQE